MKKMQCKNITDIRFGNFDGILGDELAIVGTKKVFFLNDKGKIKATINLKGTTNYIESCKAK